MNLKYGLVSVDDHIQEVPNLWTERLREDKYGAIACRISREPRMARSNGWLTVKCSSTDELLAPARS